MTLGDPLQSARDYLRGIPDLVGAGKPLTDPLQVTTKRIAEADVSGGRRVVQLSPFGGFGPRGPVDHHVRLRVRAYGQSDPDAYDTYELVRAFLTPDQFVVRGWENDAAKIIWIEDEGFIIRDIDQDYRAPYVQGTFGMIVRKRPKAL